MTRTYDQAALSILLSNKSQSAKQSALTKLAKQARGQVACPECGNEGPHDDNGCSGSERTLCCGNCGNHFDA